jgi:hypothetical protein
MAARAERAQRGEVCASYFRVEEYEVRLEEQ